MYVRVTVAPNAKREELIQTGPDRFEVYVREKAIQNMANRRVVEVIARHFGVSPGKVRIISGHQSHRKMLSVDTDL